MRNPLNEFGGYRGFGWIIGILSHRGQYPSLSSHRMMESRQPNFKNLVLLCLGNLCVQPNRSTTRMETMFEAIRSNPKSINLHTDASRALYSLRFFYGGCPMYKKCSQTHRTRFSPNSPPLAPSKTHSDKVMSLDQDWVVSREKDRLNPNVVQNLDAL